MKKTLITLTSTLTAAMIAIGCASHSAPQTQAHQTPAPSASPRPIPGNIRWMQVSAEYVGIAVQTYRLATARVEADARGRATGSWGVVLDADDTVINNLDYQSGLAIDGVTHYPERFTAFVKTFTSTAVPGASTFLSRVRALGGRIAIVTNRLQIECADTAEMLRRLKLDHDAVICRPEGAGSSSDKTPRYRAIAAGQTAVSRTPIEILVYVGDNIMDFPDTTQAIRKQGESGYGEFGVRWFLLPNPMYGSWQTNE